MLAVAGSQSAVSIHFWHGVEALGFLVVTLGGIAAVEWWQRRTKRPAYQDPASAAAGAIRRRDTLLTITALLSVAAAGVHFTVMPDHFEESALYGTFFLVTATTQVGYAALLLARPSRPLLVVGLAANAAVLGLWLVTRLVAIPLGPAAGSREEFSGLDVLASSFEVLFVACAALLVVRGFGAGTRRRTGLLLMRPAAVSFTLVAAVLIGATAYTWPPA